MFKQYIKTHTLDFPETSSEVSDSTVWETLKAYFKGLVIFHEATLIKANRERLKEIVRELSAADRIYRCLMLQSLN